MIGNPTPRRWSRLVLDVEPLRHSRPFRRLLLGQTISLIGRQLTVVAVPYQVLLLTNSEVAVGLIGLAQAIPLISVSILGGQIADRLDRRKVLLVTQSLLALCSALLAAGAWLGHPPAWTIFIVVAFAAGIGAIDTPARTSILPNLVSHSRLSSALALSFGVWQIALIAGPALAGLVLGSVGLAGAYAFDAFTFIASWTAVLLLPPQKPHGEVRETRGQAVISGLGFAWKQRTIMGTFAVDLAAMIFGMPRAVFPILALSILHVGPAGLGLLYAAIGLGGVLAVLTSGWVRQRQSLGKIVVAAVTVWGLTIVVFGLIQNFWVALICLTIAGAADSISAVCRNTIVQSLTPDHLRGRTSAFYSMVVGGGPYLGDLEAGVVAGVLSPEISIVSGGILSILGLAGAVFAFPHLWNYRRDHR